MKRKTILIIDNRTFKYEISHLQTAREELSEYFQNIRSWKFVFTLAFILPLMGMMLNITWLHLSLLEQEDILSSYLDSNPPNEDGMIFS